MSAHSLAALAEHLGHRLGEGTARAYQLGIRRAAAELGLLPEELIRRALAGDPSCYEALLAWATVQETYLFRNPEHFELAAAHARRASGEGRPWRRAWSVGCASGEEVYSLAHALLPHAPGLKVVGTDVSARALEQARAGRYGAWSFRQLRPETLGWEREEDRWCVPARLRAQVGFQELNLAAPPVVAPLELGGPPEVIFCRNVLLYFAPQPAAALLGSLVEALAEGGLLVLGALEVPSVLPAGLERLAGADGCAFVKTRPPVQPARRPAVRAGSVTSARTPAPPDRVEEARRLAGRGQLREALAQLEGSESPAGWDLAASLWIELGEPARAQAHLQRVVSLQPDHLGAHLRLALLAARQGEAEALEGSCEALRRLIAGRPADEEIDSGQLRVGYVRSVLSQLTPGWKETGT